jgi:hypothetical protein
MHDPHGNGLSLFFLVNLLLWCRFCHFVLVSRSRFPVSGLE